MDYKLNLQSPWEDVKERIKETNIEITDEDLQYGPGQDEALIKRLATKLNKSEEATKGWIESVGFTKEIAS